MVTFGMTIFFLSFLTTFLMFLMVVVAFYHIFEAKVLL
jgi:hypothetical protein